MTRNHREPRKLIGKRRFDEDRFQILNLRGNFPELLRLPRIPAVNDGRLVIFNDKPNRRHDVTDMNRGDFQPLDFHRLSDRNDLIGENSILRGRKLREVGPEVTVEEMLLENIDDLGNAHDDHRALNFPIEGFGQKGKALDMVEVGMGDENISDLRQLRQRERAAQGARIQGDRSIDEKPRWVVTNRFSFFLFVKISAVTAQHLDSHSASLLAADRSLLASTSDKNSYLQCAFCALHRVNGGLHPFHVQAFKDALHMWILSQKRSDHLPRKLQKFGFEDGKDIGRPGPSGQECDLTKKVVLIQEAEENLLAAGMGDHFDLPLDDNIDGIPFFSLTNNESAGGIISCRRPLDHLCKLFWGEIRKERDHAMAVKLLCGGGGRRLFMIGTFSDRDPV